MYNTNDTEVRWQVGYIQDQNTAAITTIHDKHIERHIEVVFGIGSGYIN